MMLFQHHPIQTKKQKSLELQKSLQFAAPSNKGFFGNLPLFF